MPLGDADVVPGPFVAPLAAETVTEVEVLAHAVLPADGVVVPPPTIPPAAADVANAIPVLPAVPAPPSSVAISDLAVHDNVLRKQAVHSHRAISAAKLRTPTA